MKRTIRIISAMFLCVLIFAFSACSLFENNSENNKIYDIGDEYFSATSFEKHVLTSIGVNGHQGGGTSYEIEIIGKCKVSLIEYSVNVKLFSSDKKILDTIESTSEKNVVAGTEISIRKTISDEVYTNIDSIEAIWCGKSYDDPAESEDTSMNPITYIDLANNDRTMLIGESFDLEYSVTPTDTDEEVEISCGDTSIIGVTNNTVTAKKAGATWLRIEPLNKKSSTRSKQLRIKVIDEFDYKEPCCPFDTDFYREKPMRSCQGASAASRQGYLDLRRGGDHTAAGGSGLDRQVLYFGDPGNLRFRAPPFWRRWSLCHTCRMCLARAT